MDLLGEYNEARPCDVQSGGYLHLVSSHGTDDIILDDAGNRAMLQKEVVEKKKKEHLSNLQSLKEVPTGCHFGLYLSGRELRTSVCLVKP